MSFFRFYKKVRTKSSFLDILFFRVVGYLDACEIPKKIGARTFCIIKISYENIISSQISQQNRAGKTSRFLFLAS